MTLLLSADIIIRETEKIVYTISYTLFSIFCNLSEYGETSRMVISDDKNVRNEHYFENNIPFNFSVNSICSFFRRTYNESFYFRGEMHDFPEAVCLLSGKVGLIAGKNVSSLSAGQIILHPANEFHSIWSSYESKPTAIIFSFRSTPTLDFPKHIYQLSDKLITELKEIQQQVDECFEKDRFIVIKPREGMEAEATHAVKRLELFLWSVLCERREVDGESVEQSLKNYILILTEMKKQLNKNLSLADLAQRCSMSVSLIEKSVYKHENCGAMALFNSLKMQAAAQLIIEGASIKEAALSIGFPNQSYFSDRFKKWAGKSPSAYRKEPR